MMPELPFVSIVVPTCRRNPQLARCLASIARLDYPSDLLEILVVDDGGEAQVPDEIRAQLPGVVVHRHDPARQGPAAARNSGVARARGAIVAFIDDDCEADAGWLRELVLALDAHAGGACGGTVVNALEDNLFAEASQGLVSFLCSYYNAEPARATFFSSNNLAFSRAALIEAGAFDARYPRAAAEDRELCNRWCQQGRPLVSAPRAIVRHAHALTAAGFLRQHYWYGTGAWRYQRARIARGGGRVPMEPLRFYGRLIAWPLSTQGWRGLPLSFLLVVAQIANAVGFFAEAVNARAEKPLEQTA